MSKLLTMTQNSSRLGGIPSTETLYKLALCGEAPGSSHRSACRHQ